MRIRSMHSVAVGATLALLLAACGGDEGPEATAPDGPTAATGATGEATVQAVDSDLGTILADADGRTLYLFESDTDGASTCYDDCAANWPALTVDGEPVAGDGVDASLLGTTERDDGSVQVTYADHPVYYFAGDQQAGDTNGQGVGEVWFVVGPDGEAVR
jgi:predicted lipoprotein with Yx(FWY)xxD motif